MLTKEQHAALRAKLVTYDAWAEQYKQKNGWTVIPKDAVPPVSVTNEERSAIEVYEFHRDKPDRYFAYVKEPDSVRTIAGTVKMHGARELYGRTGTLTTWMGDKLGTIQFGSAFRDSFGGLRVPITVYADTGETYHGTYYKSAGDYARIKKAKQQKKAA